MKLSTWLIICFATLVTSAQATERFLILQSTTSTQNSGLYEAILPEFTATTGIDVRVVAVGTGQAIKNAANCDGDVLLVHAEAAENKFVEDGFGIARHEVMYNDFVLVGPEEDPAALHNVNSAQDALEKLAGAVVFASRGDDSGTHKKERALWASAGIDPDQASGDWYRETGSGMGATLNIAVGMNAYTLTDRATWLAFNNKRNHKILFERDAALFNQYGVIAVDPTHCPKVKAQDAQRFVDWILGDGQKAIGNFRRNGEQLFFPNARP